MTAVEWLVSQLNKKGFAQVVTDEEIEQAKEMEKQKLIEMHDKGFDSVKQLNDEYAIEFAEWVEKLTPIQRVSVWSKNGQIKGLFNMDNEQLLEIFKKEKGL
jgi:hypothetical protein